jgi:predicted 3-demethylubiquinone-9 3-methyltransferase (glyoxalase superfamily)
MEIPVKAEPVKTIKGTDMQKITPFLWFDNQAEEAASFYVSVFKNPASLSGRSKVITTTRYSAEGAAASGIPKGTVMTVVFQIGSVSPDSAR